MCFVDPVARALGFPLLRTSFSNYRLILISYQLIVINTFRVHSPSIICYAPLSLHVLQADWHA